MAIAACACLSLSGVAHGQVYKWVDEQGKMHYGDRPPGEQPVSKVALPKQAIAPVPTANSEHRSTQRSNWSPSGKPVATQQAAPAVDPTQKAISDCKANRGVDCGKTEVVRQWERQNKPATKEEIKAQQEAGAARSLRRIQEDLNRR